MNIYTPGQEQFARIVRHGIARFERSGKLFVTSFLTPAQQSLAASLCRNVPHAFFGGRPEALRARLAVGVSPKDSGSSEFEREFDFSPKKEEEDFVHVLVSSRPALRRPLGHSDVLGALIHAGIERDAIGDIALDEHSIYVVCLPGISEFICRSVKQIASGPVCFEPALHVEMPSPVFESLLIHPASLRADCIVCAVCGCSRSAAKELIRQGLVKVNDEILESIRPLCNNDTISVRRTGKFRIGGVLGVSRKGRLTVQIEKYQ